MQIDFDSKQNELLTFVKVINRVDMSNFNEDECELLSFFIDELQVHALEYGI